MTLRDKLKNLVRFRRASPLNVQAGGIKRGACRGWFLILMRFIDLRISDIHRPHPGPQQNMQIGSVRCAIRSDQVLGNAAVGENPADIHLLTSDCWACGGS